MQNTSQNLDYLAKIAKFEAIQYNTFQCNFFIGLFLNLYGVVKNNTITTNLNQPNDIIYFTETLKI
jgi:hypothetical protein